MEERLQLHLQTKSMDLEKPTRREVRSHDGRGFLTYQREVVGGSC